MGTQIRRERRPIVNRDVRTNMSERNIGYSLQGGRQPTGGRDDATLVERTIREQSRKLRAH